MGHAEGTGLGGLPVFSVFADGDDRRDRFSVELLTCGAKLDVGMRLAGGV